MHGPSLRSNQNSGKSDKIYWSNETVTLYTYIYITYIQQYTVLQNTNLIILALQHFAEYFVFKYLEFMFFPCT